MPEITFLYIFEFPFPAKSGSFSQETMATQRKARQFSGVLAVFKKKRRLKSVSIGKRDLMWFNTDEFEIAHFIIKFPFLKLSWKKVSLEAFFLVFKKKPSKDG
ncbi:hypothetical protein [uncultured Dubosiella sp.]|uniref:hypothetical protein n=1 Tax=uncultured Dubosiella sp. TaxID=1937011 RepID=UPI0025945010|nr:hypothetical protein [uncultured Dubosiella sp.]